MSKKDKNKKKSFFSKLTAKFKKKTRRWFKPDSSGKTNYLARIFFEFAIATPIIILEGIKAGFYLAFTQKNGTFDAILEGILTPFWDVIKLKGSQMSSFGSSPFDATPLGLLILVEIIAFALMLTAAERLNGQSQRKDGDMTFADIDDFNEVMAYCDEAGNPIDPPENGKQVGNMILSKNVRYSLEPKGTNTYSCALVVGAIGCVDADTEYFNGTEWKKISEYNDGEKVLQFNTDTNEASLVKPEAYIKEPCDKMYHFETKYGINQTLSPDHRVVYYSKKQPNVAKVITAEELKEIQNSGKFHGLFKTDFKWSGKGIDLTDNQIKLMLMVIADGSFNKNNVNSKRCTLKLNNGRKLEEVRNLLRDVEYEIDFRETLDEQGSVSDKGYTSFIFDAPRREKEFLSYWYNASKHQLELICENVLKWNGSIDNCNRRIFSTSSKRSADFVQFAFSSCGYRAEILKTNATDKEYRVSISDRTMISMEWVSSRDNNVKLEEVDTKDGYKYCFRVPTSALVLRRNGKIFITGNCGKTFTYVKPNLLQFSGSYVITDPKGELLQDVGSALLQHGYNIKVFNINEPKFSCGYNPFHYIHSETDVVAVVDAFLQNSKDEKSGSDSFFDPAEKNFYLMLFYYIWTVYKDEPEKQTFKTFYEIYQMANEQDVALRKGEAPETSEFDKLFIELAKKDPSNPALPFYSTFKKGTPKTKQSILISVGVKLWFLSDSSIANLMAKDTMEFEKIGDRKTALFIIIPPEKKTFKFLSAMFLTQLFETLFYVGNTVNEKTYFIQKDNCVAFRSEPFNTKAERKQAEIDLIEKQKIWSKYGYIEEIETENDEPIAEDDDELMFAYKPARIVRKNADGEIVVLEEFQSRQAAELVLDAIKNGKLVKGSKAMVNHIRFLLDEFYATGKIPGFEEKIATFRSLRISSDIIIQSISQLQEMYDGLEDKIINNCSIQILLGANSMTDCEYFSKLAGQTTVKSTSLSYDGSQLMAGAKSASVSQNAQQLIRPENIRSMDKGDCLIFVNTQKPITDKKFPSTSHKNWTQTYSDKDPKLKDNAFLFREVFTIEQEEKNRVVTKLNDLQLPVDVNGRGKSGFNRPVVSGQVSSNENEKDLPNSERAKTGSVKTGIDNFNNTTKNYNKEKEDAKKRQDEVMNKMRNENVETRVSNEITNPDGSLNPSIAASLLVNAVMVNDKEAIANPDERYKKASKFVNVKIDSEDDTNMFDI